jgi:hypothetical protein
MLKTERQSRWALCYAMPNKCNCNCDCKYCCCFALTFARRRCAQEKN